MNESVQPDPDAGALKTPSLQESFLKFRDLRKKERQILKLARNGEYNCKGERTDDYKAALREKFVNAAKKYIGVPYAERFKVDDDPVAPLYLDCCALVRRAVMDLQDEFGIILGKWNQAYQMDTLPIVLQQDELKLGDLIFYEGTYNSKRSKVQKHNTVHVEIFLGGETGEATIASRFHKGRVGIFSSFKFDSTSWTLIKHHFRSLDTWLDGECKSHCPEHSWHSDILGIEIAAGKRSIFNDDSGDESAGGDSDSDCDRVHANDSHDEIGNLCLKLDSTKSSESTDDGILVTQGTSVEKDKKITDGNFQALTMTDRMGNANRSTPPLASSIKGSRGSTTHNQCPKLVAGHVPKRSQSGSTTRSCAAAVTGKRGGAAMEELGVSVTAATSMRKQALLTEIDSHALLKSSCKVASKSQGKEKLSSPMTYYVGKSNGWRLVKNSLDKRGWLQLPFEYSFSTKYHLKWVERRSQIDFKGHIPGQLVNHIPNNDCISTKIGLLKTLREKYCRVPSGSQLRKSTPWLPESYQLDSPADISAIFEIEKYSVMESGCRQSDLASIHTSSVSSASRVQGFADSGDSIRDLPISPPSPIESAGRLWIYKPSSSNRGRGIKVLRGIDALKLICYGLQTGDPLTTIPPSPGILQRYIENPLLVGPAAVKFDVRCYMLIACNEPYTAYYHPGYCRLSLKSYSATSESLDDPTVHLTNASIQKKDALYEQNKEMQVLYRHCCLLCGVHARLSNRERKHSPLLMSHTLNTSCAQLRSNFFIADSKHSGCG